MSSTTPNSRSGPQKTGSEGYNVIDGTIHTFAGIFFLFAVLNQFPGINPPVTVAESMLYTAIPLLVAKTIGKLKNNYFKSLDKYLGKFLQKISSVLDSEDKQSDVDINDEYFVGAITAIITVMGAFAYIRFEFIVDLGSILFLLAYAVHARMYQKDKVINKKLYGGIIITFTAVIYLLVIIYIIIELGIDTLSEFDSLSSLLLFVVSLLSFITTFGLRSSEEEPFQSLYLISLVVFLINMFVVSIILVITFPL